LPQVVDPFVLIYNIPADVTQIEPLFAECVVAEADEEGII